MGVRPFRSENGPFRDEPRSNLGTGGRRATEKVKLWRGHGPPRGDADWARQFDGVHLTRCHAWDRDRSNDKDDWKRLLLTHWRSREIQIGAKLWRGREGPFPATEEGQHQRRTDSEGPGDLNSRCRIQVCEDAFPPSTTQADTAPVSKSA